jgi:hypothetical protein
MLPDLRVLLVATVTTFLLATGVGLYASVRLLPEPLAAVHPDRDTPISRVALSWQDMTQAPSREIVPAAIQRDEPLDAPRPKESVAPPPQKSEDRPAAAPAAENAAPAPSAAESVAVKSSPAAPDQAKDDPATTGAIGETPSAPLVSGPPKFAARPEPVEADTHVEPAHHAAAPVSPPKAKVAKPEPRKARRARFARQPLPQGAAPASSEPTSSFFTDFGSRLNR